MATGVLRLWPDTQVLYSDDPAPRAEGIRYGSTAKPFSSVWAQAATGFAKRTETSRKKAIEWEVEAMGNTERYQSHTRIVDDHSTQSVGGIKTLEALNALKLLSGGSASQAAVDDLHQATGRDLNMVVGQKRNATAWGGDMEERIQGLRESVTAVSHRLEASKSWIGSESVNLFQVVCDALDLLRDMNILLSTHVHLTRPTTGPVDSIAFISSSRIASALATKLKDATS